MDRKNYDDATDGMTFRILCIIVLGPLNWTARPDDYGFDEDAWKASASGLVLNPYFSLISGLLTELKDLGISKGGAH